MKAKFLALSLIKKVVVILVAAVFSFMGINNALAKKAKGVEEIPFQITYIKDETLEKGKTKLKSEGKKGKKEVEYKENYFYGREKISEKIIVEPENETDYIGTREVLPITETKPIPFERTSRPNSNMNKGESRIVTPGQNGEKQITYEIIKAEEKELSRRVVKEEVIKQPVNEVTDIGTKPPPPPCDPNYSGACVPIASDVDCVGGSGNGPEYAWGPVYVIGYDIYDLDRDGDGVGCE